MLSVFSRGSVLPPGVPGSSAAPGSPPGPGDPGLRPGPGRADPLPGADLAQPAGPQLGPGPPCPGHRRGLHTGTWGGLITGKVMIPIILVNIKIMIFLEFESMMNLFINSLKK